ncbi:MAG: hypothetical protein ACFCUO_04215 [Rhodospirillales bacterium]
MSPVRRCPRGSTAIAAAALAIIAVLAAGAPAADTAPLGAFFGTFAGRTLMPMGEARNRDLQVAIRPYGAFGFSVEWRTTIDAFGNRPRERMQTLDFEPTRRPGIYTVARGDGGSADGPAEGEPYAWARLAGATLTVGVLTVDDRGDYVVQSYDRTLTADGMALSFHRVRNGRIERQLRATLKRIGD